MNEAQELAQKTSDAYSYSRYGKDGWLKATESLLKRYNREKTEVVLYSKWMRWAMDMEVTIDEFIDSMNAEQQQSLFDEVGL